MPSSFRVPSWAELWTPVAWTAEQAAHPQQSQLHRGGPAEARGRHGDRADRDDGISRRLEQAYPEDDKGWGAVLIPLHEGLVEDIRPALLVLLGAVAFVLLIACANVANLVLARTMGRRKEIGLRLALGASGARVLRQVLCETAVLGLPGGAAGLLVAQAAVQLIVAYLGKTLPEDVAIRLDLPVLGFTLAVSLLCGILSGIGAAWRLTRTNVSDALKQGLSRTDTDAGGRRTRTVLVVAEVALSLMLLVGAGLMIRSLAYLRSLDTGIDPQQRAHRRRDSSRHAVFDAREAIACSTRQLLDRVRALPGVETAGLTSGIPLDNDSGHWPISIEGRPAPSTSQQPSVVGHDRQPRLPEGLQDWPGLRPRHRGHRHQGEATRHPDQRIDGAALLAERESARRARQDHLHPGYQTSRSSASSRTSSSTASTSPRRCRRCISCSIRCRTGYMSMLFGPSVSPAALSGSLSRRRFTRSIPSSRW